MTVAQLDLSKLCQLSALDLSVIADAEARHRASRMVRDFTEDVEYAATSLQADILRNAGYVIPDAEQGTLPARAQAILARYAVVDTLAIHYRDRTKRIFILLLGLALVALIAFEVFAHLLLSLSAPKHGFRLTVWLFPLFWYLSFKLWSRAHMKRIQEKYNTYRAIAESLRVELFWTLLEVNDRVEKHFLRKHEGALEWIPRALANWHDDDSRSFPMEKFSPEKQQAYKDLVRKQWVDDQMQFFERTGNKERDAAHTCKWWGTNLLWWGIYISMLVGVCEVAQWACDFFAWTGPGVEGFVAFLDHLEHVAITVIAVMVAGAATVVAYGEKMAYAEHSRQYKTTHENYVNLAKKLGTGPLTQAEREIFLAFGIEAIEENGDWLLLHRDRPLEIVVP